MHPNYEASFADGRLNVLGQYVYESLHVRHDVIGALPPVEADDCQQMFVVCRLLICEVLLAESARYVQIRRGLRHLDF